MATQPKNEKIIRNGNVVAGLTATFKGNEKIRLGGDVLTVSELKAKYENNTSLIQTTNTRQKSWHAAVSAQEADEAELAPIHQFLIRRIQAEYGDDAEVLGSFGFEAPKRGKKSAEVKANAAKLAQATREARGTKGKRQKQDIKGSLAADEAAPPPPNAGTNGKPPAQTTN